MSQKTKKEFEGHLTLVVFPFLKMSRKGPEQTAQEIGEYLKVNEPAVAAFNVIKGFLNLTIASATWIDLLNEIQADEQYGLVKATETSPLVMIEYSSPNTNKPLHLGHVRNNLLGNALANIVAANGNKVVKTNIVNDRGIHICKSMLAWKKYGNGETPESTGKKGDHLVGDYYVSFDKHYKAELAELMEKGMTKEEAEAASPLMQEAREMLAVEIERTWSEVQEAPRTDPAHAAFGGIVHRKPAAEPQFLRRRDSDPHRPARRRDALHPEPQQPHLGLCRLPHLAREIHARHGAVRVRQAFDKYIRQSGGSVVLPDTGCFPRRRMRVAIFSRLHWVMKSALSAASSPISGRIMG